MSPIELVSSAVAFLSANQTTPGVACELFFLDVAPFIPETGNCSR